MSRSAIIRASIDRLFGGLSGVVTWERFMEAALYDPEAGYYTQSVATVGSHGDFSTSATLGGELGRGLAAWSRAATERGAANTIIELGGGDGSLARTVLRASGWRSRYAIVDISIPLIARQRRALALHAALGRVKWFATVEAVIASCGSGAVVVGNEFIDAFPCVVLRASCGGSGWEELHVERTAAGMRLVWHPATPRGIAAAHASSTRGLARGVVFEVHLTFREWLERLSESGFAGPMVFIDYGDESDSVYCRRLEGTLRGYFRHQRVTGTELLHRFGQQDLTADVNFTDVREWATQGGWKCGPLQTQAQFLERWAGASKGRLADVHDAGGSLRVIELRRDPVAE